MLTPSNTHPIVASPANKGIFPTEDAALDAVVSRLVDALDPFAIWLFGSRARGDAKPGSDFDLLVLAKPDGCFGSNDYRKVLRPVHDTWVGCDVIPCSKVDFDEAASLHTSFVASVMREGKLLYGDGA